MENTVNKDLNVNEFSVEDYRGYVDEIKVCLFSTQKLDEIVTRPMHTCLDSEDKNSPVLWFFTKWQNEIVDQVQRTPQVTLGFANISNNHYMSTKGNARINTDKNKMAELWSPIMKAWYPEGLEDPDMVLIEFHPSEAEIWDGKGKVVGLLKILSSIMTKDEYQASESGHGKIKFQ